MHALFTCKQIRSVQKSALISWQSLQQNPILLVPVAVLSGLQVTYWAGLNPRCGKQALVIAANRASPRSWVNSEFPLGIWLPRKLGVLENLSRRKVKICGDQEYRWKDSVAPNQVRNRKVHGVKYHLYNCLIESSHGGAGVLDILVNIC